MKAVFVYGSLLSKTELRETFSAEGLAFVPGKLDGFRRSFNQEAYYRPSEGGASGVLNAIPDDEAWCNGVIVAGLDDASFEAYCERESGYDIVQCSRSEFDAYEWADESSLANIDVVHLASGERWLDTPQPIPSYARSCMEGAMEWGDEFAADFLTTTVRE